MEFRNSGTFLGKRLINHVIKSLEIVQENFCGALCFMENNCVSFNTEVRGGSSSKCELNNASHNEYPQDLQPWTNYTYRGAKVTAGTKHFHPCYLNNLDWLIWETIYVKFLSSFACFLAKTGPKKIFSVIFFKQQLSSVELRFCPFNAVVRLFLSSKRCESLRHFLQLSSKTAS